ncbi:MAG: dihydroorotate dehydrogenase [Pseudomonadota bacterium]
MTVPPKTTDPAAGDDLDLLFAAAAQAPLLPSDALLARVLADAVTHQPPAAAPRPALRAAAARRPGFWTRLAAAVGGAGVLAGLGSAAMAGVMIGFAEPAALSMVTGGIYETTLDAVDLVPSFDPFLTEG